MHTQESSLNSLLMHPSRGILCDSSKIPPHACITALLIPPWFCFIKKRPGHLHTHTHTQTHTNTLKTKVGRETAEPSGDTTSRCMTRLLSREPLAMRGAQLYRESGRDTHTQLISSIGAPSPSPSLPRPPFLLI